MITDHTGSIKDHEVEQACALLGLAPDASVEEAVRAHAYLTEFWARYRMDSAASFHKAEKKMEEFNRALKAIILYRQNAERSPVPETPQPAEVRSIDEPRSAGQTRTEGGPDRASGAGISYAAAKLRKKIQAVDEKAAGQSFIGKLLGRMLGTRHRGTDRSGNRRWS